MKIVVNDIKRQYYKYQNDFDEKLVSILSGGSYILGQEVENFEKEFSSYLDIGHCVGVASGLDALKIACRILEIGNNSEVIMAENAYGACALAVISEGARPVLVDSNIYGNIKVEEIENAITFNTKAIMVVHMFGQSCDMDAICAVAKKHNLFIIEDCSQAHGATYNNKKVGTFGDIGCFSFYPTKNLGAFGDGGCIVTNSKDYANRAKILRNYGKKDGQFYELGFNSRLDEIQAGLLRIKLIHLDETNKERAEIANYYLENISNSIVDLPITQPGSTNVWHQFVIKSKYRDELKEYLRLNNIDTLIHYPTAFYIDPAFECLNYKESDFPKSAKPLSLPIYIGMTTAEKKKVAKVINEFRK